MKIVQWNNKTYQFDQDLAYDSKGVVTQTLTSGDNERCILTFHDGQLIDLVEI